MQQAKNLTPPSDPPQPHLKLHPASVDHGEDGVEVTVDPTPIIEEDAVAVPPGTVLPRRCVKCGDAMDTLPSRSIRGAIRYRLCREHVVSTVAYLVAGLALVGIGLAAVGSRLMGDPIVGTKVMLLCILLAGGGAALVYQSLPVITSATDDGRLRIRRLHAAVIDDLRRSQR
jgi:hypothetical protein